MIALDTSIVAYAVNRYAPEHPRAARAVESVVNGDAPWALPWPVVHEFLRLVTHPHAVARPLRPSDAWGFVGRLVASPSVRMLGPTERHAEVLAEVLAAVPGIPGPLLGLEIATLLREHGVRELWSADSGMRKFSFLAVRDPLRGELWEPRTRPLRRYRRLTVKPAGA